jgi:hypothetical protein
LVGCSGGYGWSGREYDLHDPLELDLYEFGRNFTVGRAGCPKGGQYLDGHVVAELLDIMWAPGRGPASF